MSVGSDLFTLAEDDIVRVYDSGVLDKRTDGLLASITTDVTSGVAATYTNVATTTYLC